MRNALTILMLSVLVCSAQTSFMDNTETMIVPQGLVGYWPMSTYNQYNRSNYSDLSGNGNNATNSGINLATNYAGIVNDTCAFFSSAKTNAFRMGNGAVFSTGNITNGLTLSCWIKQTAANSDATIMGKLFGTTSPYQTYQLGASRAGSGNVSLEIQVGSVAKTCDCAVTNKWNVWNHYVGTWDGTSEIIYLNGLASNTNSAAAGTIASTNFSTCDFSVGGIPNRPGYYFNGAIDDPRLYNRPLTSNEVYKLYNAGH